MLLLGSVVVGEGGVLRTGFDRLVLDNGGLVVALSYSSVDLHVAALVLLLVMDLLHYYLLKLIVSGEVSLLLAMNASFSAKVGVAMVALLLLLVGRLGAQSS